MPDTRQEGARRRRFVALGYAGPIGNPDLRPVISSILIEESPAHWRIHVWNRGGKAGVLCVNAEDGNAVVGRLMGGESYEER